ncbi:MAG: hypothetical protein WBX15_03585 [Thermoanaerobaculia bacterium]
MKKAATAATPKEKRGKIPVSETNINKAAARLLHAKLVSTEIFYVQRELGSTATQADVDAKVVEVRRLPWESIAMPD